MSADSNGWTREAFQQLSSRVSALEDAVKQLAGRSTDSPSPAESEIRVGGIGLATWITLLATVVIPVVLAIVATGRVG